MRQRVAFLRTLVAGKPVLALDEPFASLDAITRAEMQEWLAGALEADPRTVVLVTHDVEEALYLCDRVAVLSARPARVVDELSAPAPRAADRDAAVTDPEFVAVRERALRALHERLAMKRWLLPTLLLAALIGAWQIAASSGALADLLNLEDFLVPSPAEIAEALWESRSLLAENAWVTLQEMLLGLGCALVAGVGFAVAMHLSETLRLRPLPADRRLADDPDRSSSPRSWSSGSASGSARSWRSSP